MHGVVGRSDLELYVSKRVCIYNLTYNNISCFQVSFRFFTHAAHYHTLENLSFAGVILSI